MRRASWILRVATTYQVSSKPSIRPSSFVLLAHYHRRSSVESVFSMVKAKFGDSVRSKSDTGQVNEALCKVLAHNLCVLIHAMHALEVTPNFGADYRPALKLVD
jgi:hypothetical protein